jgi:hypothetical protein
VAASEFLFVVRLSGQSDFDHVLDAIAANVLRYLGCGSTVVSELVNELNVAIKPCLVGNVELDVRFQAHPDSCDVVVVVHDREIWRTTHCLC